MLIDQINKFWRWTNTKAVKVISTNQFGNIIFEAEDGKYWRIRPEVLECKIIAFDKADYAQYSENAEFVEGWEMKSIIEEATSNLGELSEGEVYCLKLPLVMGGLYEAKNFGKIPLEKLVSLTGQMAFQIKDLPDGSKIIFAP